MIDRVVLLTGKLPKGGLVSTYWVYYKSGHRRHFNPIHDMLPMTVLNFILNTESKTEYRDDPDRDDHYWNLANPTLIRKETWK